VTNETAFHAQTARPAQNAVANRLNAAHLGVLSSSARTEIQKDCSSAVSDGSTTVGSATPHHDKTVCSYGPPCHVVWCDHRAFKETSSLLKAQLESEVQVPVKAHKSAENVIRLLRKKQRAQGRPPCVFVVSWANSGALLPFLNESIHVAAKVIVLCDARGGRRQDGSEQQLMEQYPSVVKVAGSWTEAIHTAGKAVAEFQLAQW